MGVGVMATCLQISVSLKLPVEHWLCARTLAQPSYPRTGLGPWYVVTKPR